nr:ABC transporter substrate-binding protein [uncultured Oscillibacter sp.]
MKHRIFSLVLALALVLGLAACGSSSSSGGSSASGSGQDMSSRTDVVYGLTSDIASFDPTFTTDQITNIIYRQLYDTLVEKDENGEWVGKLAESWEISEDECTYTFYLRQDVVCHDGQPMTADDVVYSINRLLESAAFGSGMVNMQDCTKVDDYTVEIHLSSPYPATLEVLLGFGRIASCHNEDYETNPIGTGPYKFVSRSSGDNIKMEAFDQYYLGEAAIKDLTFKIITDSTTQIAALQKGELDFLTHCPLTAKATVEGDSNLVWNQTNFRGNIWVSMCENKAPFDNVLARKAVQYCVDKQAILVGGSEGLGVTMNTIFPADVPSSPEKTYTPEYSYDVEQAREYLEQYKAEVGVTEVPITILAPDTTMYLQPAITLEDMLREAGFTVTTEQIDRATFWASLYAGNYMIAVSGTSYPVNDSDGNYIYFYSTSGQNYLKVNLPELDAAFDKGRNSTDEAERLAAYTEVQKILDDNAIVVPLHQPANAVAFNAALKGVDTVNDIYQHYVYDWSWN